MSKGTLQSFRKGPRRNWLGRPFTVDLSLALVVPGAGDTGRSEVLRGKCTPRRASMNSGGNKLSAPVSRAGARHHGGTPDAGTSDTAAQWLEKPCAGTAVAMRAPLPPPLSTKGRTLNLDAPRGAPLLPRSPATPESKVEVLVRKSATRFLRGIRTGLSCLADRHCFGGKRRARWSPILRAQHPGGRRTAHLVLAPVHNDPWDNRRRFVS